MGVKELKNVSTANFANFKPELYKSERIMVEARDKYEFPCILTYNKDLITSESCMLICLDGEAD